MLDELCAGGELVWIGAGQGRVALYLRGETALLHTPADVPEHAIVAALRGAGADVLRRSGDGRRRARPHGARRALGARLGGRGHERLVASAARRRGAAGAAAARAGAPGPGRPAGAADLVTSGGARPLVARREPRACGSGPGRARPGAGRDAARPPRRADARRRAGRGHPGRLRGGLRRAADDGGGRPLPARLLRRGPRRRPVRGADGGRAPARRARRRPRGGRDRALGDRSGQPLRRHAAVAGVVAAPGARRRVRGS